MTFQREHVLTERQAREARERRWAEFQSKTLIELQEALAEVMAEAFYLVRQMREVKEGDTKAETINVHGKQYGIKLVRARMLLGRIQDDQVERRAWEAIEASNAFRDFGHTWLTSAEAYDEEAGGVLEARIEDAVTNADMRIGEVLKSLR
jgi:hypothetical protein